MAESVVFGLLYALTVGRKPMRAMTRIALTLDLLQLISFAFDTTRFPWGPLTKQFVAVPISYLRLPTLPIDSIILFDVAFYLIIVFSFIGLADAIYVGLSVKRGEYRHVWPIRLLRTLVSTMVTVLYIPVLTILVVPWDCRDGHLAAYTDESCTSTTNGIRQVFSVIVGPLLSILSLAVAAVFFDSSPRSNHVAARVHARWDAQLLIVKTILTLIFSSSYLVVSAILFLFSSVFLYASMIFHLPYFNRNISIFRAITCSSVFITSVILLILLGSGGGEVAGDVIGLVWILLLVPFSLLGGYLAHLRINHLANPDRYEEKLKKIKTEGDDEDFDAFDRRLQLTRVFNSPFTLEAAVRLMLITPHELRPGEIDRRIKISEALYEAAITRWPSNPALRLFYSSFLATYLDQGNTAYIQLEKAKKLNPFVDFRFLVYSNEKAMEHARRAQGIAQREMDMLTYAEYAKSYRDATLYHARALKYIRRFWSHLLKPQVDMMELLQIARRFNTAQTASQSQYLFLLRNHPNSPRLLRSFASFCEDVCNDPWTAQEAYARAEMMEEDQAQRHREKYETEVAELPLEPKEGVLGASHSRRRFSRSLVDSGSNVFLSIHHSRTKVSPQQHDESEDGLSDAGSMTQMTGPPVAKKKPQKKPQPTPSVPSLSTSLSSADRHALARRKRAQNQKTGGEIIFLRRYTILMMIATWVAAAFALGLVAPFMSDLVTDLDRVTASAELSAHSQIGSSATVRLAYYGGVCENCTSEQSTRLRNDLSVVADTITSMSRGLYTGTIGNLHQEDRLEALYGTKSVDLITFAPPAYSTINDTELRGLNIKTTLWQASKLYAAVTSATANSTATALSDWFHDVQIRSIIENGPNGLAKAYKDSLKIEVQTILDGDWMSAFVGNGIILFCAFAISMWLRFIVVRRSVARLTKERVDAMSLFLLIPKPVVLQLARIRVYREGAEVHSDLSDEDEAKPSERKPISKSISFNEMNVIASVHEEDEEKQVDVTEPLIVVKEPDAAEDAAAIQIQRVFRGYQSRSKHKAVEEKVQEKPLIQDKEEEQEEPVILPGTVVDESPGDSPSPNEDTPAQSHVAPATPLTSAAPSAVGSTLFLKKKKEERSKEDVENDERRKKWAHSMGKWTFARGSGYVGVISLQFLIYFIYNAQALIEGAPQIWEIRVAGERQVMLEQSMYWASNLSLGLGPSDVDLTVVRAELKESLDELMRLHRGLVDGTQGSYFTEEQGFLPGSANRDPAQTALLTDENACLNDEMPCPPPKWSQGYGGLEGVLALYHYYTTLLMFEPEIRLVASNPLYVSSYEIGELFLRPGLHKSTSLYANEINRYYEEKLLGGFWILLSACLVAVVFFFVLIYPLLNRLKIEELRTRQLLLFIPSQVIQSVQSIRERFTQMIADDGDEDDDDVLGSGGGNLAKLLKLDEK